jgi:adenylate cyclase
VCRAQEADVARGLLCERFAVALRAFQARRWDEAAKTFQEIVLTCGEDGPSRYYLRLCERYRADPPESSWTGVVVVA